jgi:hypothetical protein
LRRGIAKGGSLFAGVWGVPHTLPFSPRAACGGVQKKKKEFLRGHPALGTPGFETFVSNVRDDS